MKNSLKSISESREWTVDTFRSSVLLRFYLITVSGVVIGFIFFTGWAYAYHYFAYFKLGLLALKLPIVTYLGFSFWVFQSVWWLLIPYALGALAVAIHEPRLAVRLKQIRAERPWSLAQLFLTVTLLVFLLSWWVTSISAGRFFQAQQANRFVDLPLVSVWLNEPATDETLRALYAELPTGVYRVLLEDRERLFLFKPPSDGKQAQISVIELPWKEVKLVRVLP